MDTNPVESAFLDTCLHRGHKTNIDYILGRPCTARLNGDKEQFVFFFGELGHMVCSVSGTKRTVLCPNGRIKQAGKELWQSTLSKIATRNGDTVNDAIFAGSNFPELGQS